MDPSSLPAAASAVAAWLFIVGIVGAGGAAVAAAGRLVEPDGRRVATTAQAAWLVASTGALVLTERLRSRLGVNLGDLASTPVGGGAVLRGAGLLVAGLALVGQAARPRARSPWMLAAAGVVVAVIGHARTGHANAAGIDQVALQALHIVAIVAWLGVLAAMAVSPGQVRWERYSLLPAAGLIVAAATGALRAANELGAPGELLDSAYGLLVVAKTELFFVLAGLGAVNRWRVLPSLPDSGPLLRRVAAAELAVGALAGAVAAVLGSTATPG